MGDFDEDSDTSSPDEQNPLLKFSLAGAQLKYSLAGSKKGLTIPASGEAGTVILKLPDERAGFSGVPEAEHGSLQLARASGIRVPDNWLVNVDSIAGLEKWAVTTNGQALAIDRFDRSPRGRVHMEEVAQILLVPTAIENAKYMRANHETVARITGALCTLEEVGEIIDRITFNILLGNGDAHLKNWAFIYPDGRSAQLSPLYDVLPTVLYIAEDRMGMKLDDQRSFEAASRASFNRLGERSGFGGSAAQERALNAAAKVIENWALLRDYLTAENYRVLTDRLSRLGIVNDLRSI
ncbi:HipA domain-containing protein [Pseudonocardia sp. NPDC046786]|uniref:type II toxin-antitoxin system HipA family toxin n=1 Tax=Pseudonocardia sp. NPDC046786 TaxID=3155471 RepID=UPI0033E995FF